MKWRISISILVAALWLVSTFNFGTRPSFEAQGFGVLFLLMFMALLVFNVVGVSALWKRHKTLGLLPLLITLGACVASGPVRSCGVDDRIKDFRANQSKYDEIVSKVLSREIPDPKHDDIRSPTPGDKFVAFQTPEKYRALVPYLITADREGTNTVAIRLVLCVMFPSHHRAYLWCPDGRFKDRLRTWENIQTVINTNWCAISD